MTNGSADSESEDTDTIDKMNEFQSDSLTLQQLVDEVSEKEYSYARMKISRAPLRNFLAFLLPW